MKISNNTLRLIVAKEKNIIKSNAEFWKKYENKKDLINLLEKITQIEVNEVIEKYKFKENNINIISIFDEEFPIINKNVKKKSEKPYLFFLKGNLLLLNNLNKNIAVIGLINPNNNIEEREVKVINELVDKNLTIVSGLAKGCDSIAHKTCINKGGNTIAFLGTPLDKISPKENKNLADEIVQNNGLIISEYYKEHTSKFEIVDRLIKRDRLQAMFSKAVILIASYRKNEGDSGARHAIEFALSYGVDCFVLYNKEIDFNNNKFALNKDLLLENSYDIKVLKKNSIDYIENLTNKNLIKNTFNNNSEQLKMENF